MIKINQLEIENVKRIKAVKVEPSSSGLTIIGGKNNQGKTSVLDSIAWALGGNQYRPSAAQREESVIPPHLHIVLSNGLVVERKGKNSDLKVTDPNGNKGGQQLLNEFVEQLALDLPKFMSMNSREKAEVLLQIIGVKEQLNLLERQETEIYNRRHAVGQIADQKAKFAKEMTTYLDAPKDLISPSELICQQQEILARNGENERKRQNLARLQQQEAEASDLVIRLETQLLEAKERLNGIKADVATAQKSAENLQDESTAELEENIRNIEEINRKVRANLDKNKAEDDANEYRQQYDTLTSQLNSVRTNKADLLTNANLPLPELSVQDGELTYKGHKWDSMSGSDQLKVSTAIVRKLNPKCGFVLLDKLEQMDMNTLGEFGAWLETEGLQAIATRVSTGGECSIIVEDGYSVNTTQYQADMLQMEQEAMRQDENESLNKTWKAGEF